jgi:MYXO-CTERM domain-containing protein
LFAVSCAADLGPVQADLPDTGPLLLAATSALAPQHASDLHSVVAADRRQFDAAGPARFTASPRFGLTGELTAQGLRASTTDDSVFLATVAYGNVDVGGAEPELGDCAHGAERVAASCVRQVELDHGDITEWWVSRADGLEHGWTLHAPPEDGPVVITVALSTGRVLEVDNDGAGATLLGSQGGLWRYDGLVAWDNDGVALPARLVDDGTQLRVEVDVTGARWPVTVDPALSTEIKLTASDGSNSDLFGYSVSGAGDVDADGYDDIVVGAYADSDSGFYSGSAYVYYGSATGIDTASEDKLIASDGAAQDLFGNMVSGAGDLNGDGNHDIVVGARQDDDNGSNSGSVYVYYGSATGIDSASEDKLTAGDGAVGDYFGTAATGAGDLDGDGYDDLVVGAYADDDNGDSSGSVYVYHGSAKGISGASEDKLTPSDGVTSAYFGWSLSGAGDLDGDGYDDLVVGATLDSERGAYSGSVYIYGSPGGLDSASEDKLTASDGESYEHFGWSVSGAGDLDADGYDDLVVGVDGDDDYGSASGAVFVFYGSATGINSASEDKLTASDAAADDYFGWSVSGAGDVDGDGYDDVVVGAPGDDDSGSFSGSAYVYYGSATGISNALEDKLNASDGAVGDGFGYSVSVAGDIDGDGFDDLLAGAYQDDDNGSSSGSAYVYEGGCRDLDEDGYRCDVDCDDSDAAVFPGATEIAGDGLDQDCDGAETCIVDADDDGYIDGTATVASADADCSDAGEGLATDPTGDCNDNDAAVNPDADEVCDEVDNDCDGSVDDDPVDVGTWYADSDNDGYGDPDASSTACDQPDGTSADATDCDDSDATIHPGATEVEDDGIDQDCDGADAVAEVEEEDEVEEVDEVDEAGKGGCGGCAVTKGPSSATGVWLLLGLLGVGLRRRHDQRIGA